MPLVSVNSSLRLTRRGTIRTVIAERYLRDDIPCGLESCSQCDFQPSCTLTTELPILIPDFSVTTTQMALLESPEINNIVILDSIFKKVPTTTQKRLKRILLPGPNDPFRRFYCFANQNHRSTATIEEDHDTELLSALSFYTSHVTSFVVLLSENEDLIQTARSQGITAFTTLQYVSSNFPALIDVTLSPSVSSSLQSSFFKGYSLHVPTEAALSAVTQGTAFIGIFHSTKFNCFKGTVSGSKIDTPIILSGRDYVNRAMDGDRVIVTLLPREEWPSESPCGRVICIVNRAWRDYCGSIDPEGILQTSAYFVPVSPLLPKFRIRTPRNINDYLGKRLVTRVDDWSENDLFPIAHVVRVVGPLGNRDVEAEVILIEHSVPYNEFGQDVLNCLPPVNFTISDTERSKRFDFTRLPICSIDPPGCRDIDDALHGRYIIENGKTLVEIGVHIADVSYFVRPNTPMDLEAKRRSTTCYLVDKRIDMLPRLLTEDLCSLRCNVERFAFSCIWVMDPSDNYKVTSCKFGKSIINSQASFTYQEAQKRKDDVTLRDDLTESIRILAKVALSLRQGRMDAGALVLASTAVKFNFDEVTREPFDVNEYENFETNYLVEEFMLLANHYVAHQIFKAYPSQALLRRHPAPQPHAFDLLLASIKPLGLSLKTDTNKDLAQSLELIPRKYEKYLKQQVTQCMSLAQYFTSGEYEQSEYFHYGLSLDLYTHFTSPIRRYADVIVHRLLAASIGQDELFSELAHKDRITEICNNLNFRHKNAQDAGRQSSTITSLFLLRDPVKQHAIVTRIMEKGIVAFVPKYGLDALIKLSDRADYTFVEEKREARVGDRKIVLFDRIDVVLSVDEHAKTHSLKAKMEPLFLIDKKVAMVVDADEMD
ncbi:hypothetical protein RCL1_005109 [Eukaryota sp. TZLM3-RCL]